MSKQVVGIYENGEEAVKVVEELLIQGYKRDEISIVAKDRKETKVIERKTGTKAEEGLATGAATGELLAGRQVCLPVRVHWPFQESDPCLPLDRLYLHWLEWR